MLLNKRSNPSFTKPSTARCPRAGVNPPRFSQGELRRRIVCSTIVRSLMGYKGQLWLAIMCWWPGRHSWLFCSYD
ncbi:hypothetical protein Pyn_01270 [Prunus yedoensis var. nudiflora]|uniref:Uncharacterized protein n=1 Tax=Prunus yedoensis var. nudiflora TaxID=2094558 RepID=A0A314XVG4_PRUYE|nr:hypothetical protein Pyn_01270 [Prunus yedoensis var. nudiflora]